MTGSTQLIISSVFVMSTLVCFISIIKTLDISNTAIRQSLQTLLLFSGGWSMLQFIQLLVISQPVSHAIQLFGLMFGICTVPSWLFFVSAFTGRNFHRSKKFKTAVILSIFIVLSIKGTNPIHNLYFTVETLNTPFRATFFNYKIVHHILTLISYSIILYGFKLLYGDIEKLPISKSKLNLVAGFLLFPAGMSVLSTFNVTQVLGSVSYDPIGVSVFSILILFFAESSSKQFHIARHNSFFNGISDAVIIVEKSSHKIQDFNTTAQEEPFNLSEADVNSLVGEKFDNLSLGTDIVTINERTYSIVTTSYFSDLYTESYAIVFKDITEIEKQKQQLEIQTSHFENMVEGLSHEVRNGLQIVQGYSDLDDVGDKELSVISNTADRLNRVSEDLTALAKVGQSTTPVGSVQFESIMSGLQQDSELLQGVELNYNGSGEIYIERQIFRLLIEKVVMFSQKTGSSQVSITLTEDALEISNDGDGIDGRDPYGAFEYGKSIPSAELGSILPVVKSISDAHGWDLEITETQDRLQFTLSGVAQPSLLVHKEPEKDTPQT